MVSSRETPAMSYRPALTWRSASWTLFGLVALALWINFGGVITVDVSNTTGRTFGSEPLAVPALILGVGLAALSGLLFLLAKVRLVSRPEFFFILYSCLIAAPLMSNGFWRYLPGVVATIPVTSDFEKRDALPDALWPGGPNLLQAFRNSPAAGEFGPGSRVDQVEVTPGQWESGWVIETKDEGSSRIRIRVPLAAGREGPKPGEPFMISVLARGSNYGPTTLAHARLYADGEETADSEIFLSRQSARTTVLQPGGFIRLGSYGVAIPERTQEAVVLEFGLSGRGRLELARPEMVSVAALESLTAGRRFATESEWNELSEIERAGVVVRPDRLLSLAGLRFVLGGYIPWEAWLRPFLAWSGLAALILAGSFAMVVIYRKQWMENERYPLPLAQVPLALIPGEDEEREGRAFPKVWRHPMVWVGFGVAFFFCFLKGWNTYSPEVPTLAPYFNLQSYFTGAGWGQTWREVEFRIFWLALGLALLMELNVLLSLVMGYFLFRAQYWLGEGTGLGTATGYPYPRDQMLGALIAYGGLILWFTRRHLVRYARQAWRGGNPDGEALAPRTALVLLALCAVGAWGWSVWVGLPPIPMMLFFGGMLLLCLVMAKIRAECGIPASAPNFTTSDLLVVSMIGWGGSLTFWGVDGALTIVLAGALLVAVAFLLIPGAQAEAIELGRRARARPSHLKWIAVFGVAGGLAIGFWAYLSAGYALGTTTFPVTGEFGPRTGSLGVYNAKVVEANAALESERAETAGNPRLLAAAVGGGVMGGLVMLRQAFAGFWFHPVGFFLGFSPLLQFGWGSILAAWAIRFTVLKLGGAVTVRTQLVPLALGIVGGSLAAHAFFGLLNFYHYFFTPGLTRFTGEL